MAWEDIQIIAGSISSFIFICGTLSMLVKAWLTKDMASYSISALALNTGGNLIHWLYISSLPLGPIYALHGFHTVATVLMLVGSLVYRHHPQAAALITRSMERVTDTLNLPIVEAHGSSTDTQEFPAVR